MTWYCAGAQDYVQTQTQTQNPSQGSTEPSTMGGIGEHQGLQAKSIAALRRKTSFNALRRAVPGLRPRQSEPVLSARAHLEEANAPRPLPPRNPLRVARPHDFDTMAPRPQQEEAAATSASDLAGPTFSSRRPQRPGYINPLGMHPPFAGPPDLTNFSFGTTPSHRGASTTTIRASPPQSTVDPVDIQRKIDQMLEATRELKGNQPRACPAQAQGNIPQSSTTSNLLQFGKEKCRKISTAVGGFLPRSQTTNKLVSSSSAKGKDMGKGKAVGFTTGEEQDDEQQQHAGPPHAARYHPGRNGPSGQPPMTPIQKYHNVGRNMDNPKVQQLTGNLVRRRPFTSGSFPDPLAQEHARDDESAEAFCRHGSFDDPATALAPPPAHHYRPRPWQQQPTSQPSQEDRRPTTPVWNFPPSQPGRITPGDWSPTSSPPRRSLPLPPADRPTTGPWNFPPSKPGRITPGDWSPASSIRPSPPRFLSPAGRPTAAGSTSSQDSHWRPLTPPSRPTNPLVRRPATPAQHGRRPSRPVPVDDNVDDSFADMLDEDLDIPFDFAPAGASTPRRTRWI